MRRERGHPLIAGLMDHVMRPLDRIRAKVVPDAHGRVLEIGLGTGLNLAHYASNQVRELVAVEPDPHMRRRAEARLAASPLSATLSPASAEALPFEDHSFDEVVVTFTLCTVPDVERAIGEMRRVLVPGGVVRFAEHTRSDTRLTAWLQRVVDPVYTRLAGGCHLDRDPVSLLRAGGFDVEEVHGHGRTPLNFTPLHRGIARRR